MTDKPSRRHRIGIFAPFVLVVLLFAGWSLYWFQTAHRLEQQLTHQRDALTKAGYRIAYTPFHIRGYPYRMVADVKYVTVIGPSGRGFAAARLEAQANAWALDTWVMVLPSSGFIVYRGHPGGVDLGQMTVQGQVLRASVSHIGRPVWNIALQGIGLTVTPSDPNHPFAFATAGNFEAYVRPNAKTRDAADILMRITDATGLPKSLVAGLGGGQPLSAHIETTIDQVSALHGGGDALKAWGAAGGKLNALKAEVRAGNLSLFGHSDALSLQPDGHVTGRLGLDMSGTFKPIEVLGALRILSPETMTLAKPLLDLALATKSPQTFDVDFRNGGAYIGPLKVSNAPIFP